MPGVDGDFVQLRHQAVNAKGLIPQLTGLNHLIAEAHIRLYRLRFRALEGQVLRSHIAVLAVRGGHLIPAGRGFVEHDDLAALFVLAENFVICARSRTQMQWAALGCNLVNLHVVGAGLVLLGDQAHAGGHGGGHRRAKNAAFRKSRPFAALVDVVHQRQFPLAVQHFGHGAGHGRNRAEAIARKVGAVGRIYTDQEPHLLQGIKKAPNQSADAQKINWNILSYDCKTQPMSNV